MVAMSRMDTVQVGRRSSYNFRAARCTVRGKSLKPFAPRRLHPGMVAETPDGEHVEVVAVFATLVGHGETRSIFEAVAVVRRTGGGLAHCNARLLRPVRFVEGVEEIDLGAWVDGRAA